MKIPRYTIDNLHQQFPDDNACLDYIFKQRFGGMVACSKCGVAEPKYYRVRSKKVYECKDCGNQISPLANTIFHKSETPLKKWFYAVYMFSVSRNGVSGKELERTLGVTYKTAWRMCKQIRLMMQQSSQPLTGVVEIDETYMGGTRRKVHQKRVNGITKRQLSAWLRRRKAKVRSLLLLLNRPMPLLHYHSSVQWRIKMLKYKQTSQESTTE